MLASMVLGLLFLLLFQPSDPTDASVRAAELERRAAELLRLGLFDQAAHSEREALGLWHEVAQTTAVDLAAPHFNLAQVYLAQGKLSAAEHEIRLARQLDGRDSNSSDRARMSVLSAQIHAQEGDYAGAALELQSAIPSLTGTGLATALNDLGMFRAAQGRLTTAADLIEHAISIRIEAGADTGPDQGRILANLALVRFRQGQLAVSASLYDRAIRILEHTSGLGEVQTGMALAEYSQVLRKMGRKTEAQVMERRAKAVLGATFTPSFGTIDIRSLK
jgi:tetratricopeptide (TPR) repeat protein